MKEIVLGKRQKRKVKMFDRSKMNEIVEAAETSNGRLELIQALIPLGLKAVHDELHAELERLTGTKHRHDGKLNRWGTQPGSVCLGEQKFRIEVPRVRDTRRNMEVPLQSYGRLQATRQVDERVMNIVAPVV